MTITLTETRRTHEDTYDAIAYSIQLDGIEIGTASVQASATAYVERIDIDAAQRGQGYGTEALRQLSRLHGGIYLAPDNEDARRLYERIGIEYTGDDAEYIDQGFGVYEI